jgi:glycosyltransferase involved in cell wall biosynthesis
MSTKRMSIIIPVYKVEKYIRKCLESVFKQDIPPDTYEIIIVNDGTPDNSMSIVHEFANKYTNLTIINQENQGLSMARNNGLDIAHGEYVWFVDSDDWIKENCLNKIIGLIEQYKFDILSMPLLCTHDECNEGKEDISIKDSVLLIGKKYLFSDYPFAPTQRLILKRKFIIENNLKFYPKIFHEDTLFGPPTIFLANKIYMLNKSLYYYRQRQDGSIMSSWKIKNSNDLVFGYNVLKSFESQYILDKSDKEKFNDVIITSLLCSILFAKGHWKSKDFKIFYSQNVNFIRKESWQLFLNKDIRMKRRIRGLLFFLSPFLFVFLRLSRTK